MQTHFKLIELQLFPLKFSVQASAEESFQYAIDAIRCEMNEFSPFSRLLNDEVKITSIYNTDTHIYAHKHISRILHTDKKMAINLRKRERLKSCNQHKCIRSTVFSIDWETIASIIIVLSNKWMAIFLVHD